MAGPAYYSAVMNISKNEDWGVPFVYGTTDSMGDFTPLDLTGSTIKMEIRKTESDHEALVSVLTPDQGISFTDITNGAFSVLIVRDQLARLPPGQYVVDMVRLMPNTLQERLWEGTCTVVEGTTR
jgi:hypothetical protein